MIAARDDWPTDRVVKALTDGGAEVFRMDTAEFPMDLTLTGRIDARRGWSGGLATVLRAVDLAGITAVYYRAPNAFALPPTMSESERRFAAAQARSGLGGIITAPGCRWVSHPAAMSRAEYKPLQLATARACGLSIPPTLVTNRADAVRDFVSEIADLGGQVICKPVASPVLIEDGQLKTIYTRLLTDDDLNDLRGIETTAHLFQAWMPKLYEVRLTVVGHRLLAAEIHAESDAPVIDWRSDYTSLAYQVTEVPDSVAAGVRSYMDRLDLRFAAMDFIVGPDFSWTFLEANPCGQWDWIQHATGLPIAQAIADELQGVTT
ncbi:ATP-grasp ribosomal peptide maturase [Streptomyces sp. NPDC001817]|uniref:ATP-grasp ribosomal peptide maturase n=1 Tax=Streptomyces sp. NPDC001817 TaxID=3154398 RepID=UPI00332E0DF9